MGKKCLESLRLADFNAVGISEKVTQRKSRARCETCVPESMLQVRGVLNREYALVKIRENSDHVQRWVKLHEVHSGFLPHSLYDCRTLEYNDDAISSKNSKLDANQVFADAVSLSPSRGAIIYLEAQSFLTTRTLLANQIFSLKMPVNFSPRVVNTLLKADLPTTLPLLGTMLQVLQENIYDLRAAWFDFCGSFDGSENCKPQQDIQFLFQSQQLLDDSIFAVTFCLRDARRPKLKAHQKQTRIRTWIRRTASKHGYNLKCLQVLRYFPQMLFLVYKCSTFGAK